MDSKSHHCFNCGTGTDSWDEIDGKKVYICDDSRCIKEYRYQSEVADNEKRWRAEEDNYDRY